MIEIKPVNVSNHECGMLLLTLSSLQLSQNDYEKVPFHNHPRMIPSDTYTTSRKVMAL